MKNNFFNKIKEELKYTFSQRENFNNPDIKNKWYRHLPNIFSGLRIILSPIILVFAALGLPLISIITGVVCALTDLIDGRLATWLNAKSEFGRRLDPVADKIFATTILTSLMIMLGFPLCLFLGSNLLLELVITKINTDALINNKNPHTIFLGRFKTFLLFSTMAIGLLNLLTPVMAIVGISSLATLIFQVKTACKYYEKAKKQEQVTQPITNEDKTSTEELEPTKTTQNNIELVTPITYESDGIDTSFEEIPYSHSGIKQLIHRRH